MRVLLFTGKGGAGKTTIAAGTAALAARNGIKTLVLSTDPAHSMADALALPQVHPGDGVVEVGSGLSLLQLDVRDRFARAWGEIQGYLLEVLDSAGMDPIEAEELALLPGAEEVLALLEVRDRVRSNDWDAVVVDCAPTGETLRLLALPEALGWYMDRIWPAERRLLGMLRPVLRRRSGVPMPRDRVLDAVERLHADLLDVHQLLTGPDASVRLVMTPEAVVAAEARRTLTSLSLYGYRVDGVVANKVFPADGADAWRSGWANAQAGHLAQFEADVRPLPVWQVPYQAGEPIGESRLSELAAQCYGDSDALAPAATRAPLTVERDGADFILSLALPLAAKGDVDLVRRADELVVTIGADRRVLALPTALRRCAVTGAKLDDGLLRVVFRPDPDRFLRTSEARGRATGADAASRAQRAGADPESRESQ